MEVFSVLTLVFPEKEMMVILAKVFILSRVASGGDVSGFGKDGIRHSGTADTFYGA